MRYRWFIGLAIIVFVVSKLTFGNIDVQVPDGHKVIVLNHGYHSAIVLSRDDLGALGGPVSRGWLADFPDAHWFEFGWGDRGFFLESPTLDDVSFAIVAKALFWPSPSVFHVATAPGEVADVFSASDLIRFSLAENNMADLIAALETGAAGRYALGPGLYLNSLFYEGAGSYHLFYTCNSWVASVLRAGGVNASPLFAQSSTVMFWELRLRYNL